MANHDVCVKIGVVQFLSQMVSNTLWMDLRFDPYINRPGTTWKRRDVSCLSQKHTSLGNLCLISGVGLYAIWFGSAGTRKINQPVIRTFLRSTYIQATDLRSTIRSRCGLSFQVHAP